MRENHSMSHHPESKEAAFEVRGVQRLGLWLMGGVIVLWARSMRMRIAEADREALSRCDRPVAMFIWHNRLFIGAELVRRVRGGKPFHGIISASKDGAWLVGFFEMLGIKAIRGSSSWGGREAVNAMIRTAQEGKDLGITPDGPRGPIYEFKPGGLIIARRAKVPLVLLGIEFTWVKQLRSWDRFIIPLPFTTMTVRCRRIRPEDLPSDRGEALAELTAIMTEINGSRH